MSDLIALAYSGGLDTSWLVPHLKEAHPGSAILTVTVDVGGLDEAAKQALEDRAYELGAVKHVFVDAREDYFDEVLRFLVMGNVLKGDLYPLCVGAERGLQAREVARVAIAEGARAIAHGSTAAGNDQVRFEVVLRTLAPQLELLAPIRELAPSREDEINDLKQRGLPLPAGGGAYSVNEGLWGVTIGGVETLDTVQGLPESAWVRTKGAFDAPRRPCELTIGFGAGVPCSLNGEDLAPVPLIEKLDALGASYGLGRGIHLGETLLGHKGRVAFEAPAATALITAHRELEKLVLTATQSRVKKQVAEIYGELVHGGLHLEPAARDIEALLLSSQERVTGEVSCELAPGRLMVTGVRSPHSLRDASRSAYGEAVGEWTPQDAGGFCRLYGLSSVLHARAKEGEGTW